MLEQPLLFTSCSSIQFFNSPRFPKDSQLCHLHLNVQPLYHFWDAIPGHWSPSGSHPTLPKEVEDFPRGGNYPRDTPLPTFLA